MLTEKELQIFNPQRNNVIEINTILPLKRKPRETKNRMVDSVWAAFDTMAES